MNGLSETVVFFGGLLWLALGLYDWGRIIRRRTVATPRQAVANDPEKSRFLNDFKEWLKTRK